MHTEAWTPILAMMLQVGLIIGLARLFSWSMRRLGQPAVVAEIMAGIALGPSLLGWLWPEGMQAVFRPESLPLLSTVSEFGLVLFMFLVGMEFDPRLMQGRGRSSAFISTAGIVVPFSLGFLLAGWLFPDYAGQGAAFLAFALFMGAAMSVTAFPVLARILAERRLVQSKVGAVSLASAAVGDVAAWCILAFVISVARAEGTDGALVTTVLSAAYIAVMLWVVRPLLKRLDSRAGEVASQNLLAAATLLLLASATVTELIGIHALFGGFLLGAVMPREGGLTTTLVARMEDLIVVVILPLFFAFSGLRTEIGLVGTSRDLLVCGLVVLVASIGKFGGTALAAKLVGMSGREAGAIGILMNTRGLMELIVLNIGLDLGVLNPQMFTIMVIMALLTTVAASPLLEWVYPHTAREEAILVPPRRPPSVLLCVSDQSIAPAMVVLASSLAGRDPRRVVALHVLPADRPSVYLRAGPEATAGRLLSRVRNLGRRLGTEIHVMSTVSSEPAREIERVAEIERPELVLLGAHRPVWGRSPFGGVVQEVMRRVTSPVGLLVDNGLGALRRVLAVVNHSLAGAAAADVADRLAKNERIELTRIDLSADGAVVRPVGEPPLRQPLPSEAGNLLESLQVLLSGKRLGDFDLVVVGIGAGGPAGRPPPGVEELVRGCPTSVLFVRAPAGDPVS
jgi:Kef-type K+ transport system membrane component KefB/nucleotide-binding universal stress UspA family protein